MASRELFVDTSAWFPLLLRRHPDHAPLTAALRKRIGAGDRIVTTNLVVAESYTLLVYRGHRDAALTFIRSARTAPNLVVDTTAELEELALVDWLEPFDDQRLSLADAVSFAVMRERGITHALTLDTHFVIAGFEVLPAIRRR